MNRSQAAVEIEKQLVRRSILDWRDNYMGKAILQLDEKLPALLSAIDKRIDNAQFGELLTSSKSFGRQRIEPLFKSWVEQESTRFLTAAEADLRKICTHSIQQTKNRADLANMPDTNEYANVAIGAISTGAGIAAVPLFTSLTTVSGAGLLGLLTATVSWPVALVGVVTITALLGFGSDRLIKIKARAVEKYKKSVHAFIEEKVIGSKDSSVSLARGLQTIISKAATQALGEIDK